MTEKRFTYQNTYGGNKDGFLNTMNGLNEKNKKLQKENEQLRHDATILIQSNQDYRRENEQLKHQLQQQELEYATTCNRLTEENEQLKDIIDQLRTDNTKQKKLLNTTMKQNKHTTTTIKTMIDTERTELGKSVLKQLWSAIQ